MGRVLDHEGTAYAVRAEGGVAVFEFRNSVLDVISDLKQKAELFERIADASATPTVEALLFRNCAHAFDESEVQRFHECLFGAQAPRDRREADYVLEREECGLEQFVEAIHDATKPTVIALQGRVVGPFFGLSLAFDLRLASRETLFSAAAVDGVPPGGGLGLFLPLFVGLGRAREILLEGMELPAWRAREMGLVSEVISGGNVAERTVQAASRLAHAGSDAAILRQLTCPFTREELLDYFERESRLLKRAWHRVAAA